MGATCRGKTLEAGVSVKGSKCQRTSRLLEDLWKQHAEKRRKKSRAAETREE